MPKLQQLSLLTYCTKSSQVLVFHFLYFTLAEFLSGGYVLDPVSSLLFLTEILFGQQLFLVNVRLMLPNSRP